MMNLHEMGIQNKKIYPTEVGGCMLGRWYEAHNYPKGPPHIKSLIGTVTHDYVEQMMKHGEIKERSVSQIEDYRKDANPFMLEVIDNAYAGAERYIPRIEHWLSTTSLLDSDIGNFILDFKTGKSTLWKSTKIQMGGYQYLMENSNKPIPLGRNSEVGLRADLDLDYLLSGRLDLYNRIDDTNIYDIYVIYLGDIDSKLERKLTLREVKECISLFTYELPRTIAIRERINKEGYRPHASSYCSLMPFCKWRGLCQGL